MANFGNLNQYDMVLAVDQTAINHQLASVFGEENRTEEIINFLDWDLPFYKALDSGEKKKTAVLECTFETPYVDFNTSVDQGCRLNLPIKTGVYKYLHIDLETFQVIWKEIKMDGIVFSITTNLSAKEEPQFSDDTFTVQALTLLLEEITPDEVFIDLSKEVTFKNIRDIAVELKTIVTEAIIEQAREHQEKYNKPLLLLGKVKVPKVRKTKGPLAPLAAKYSVFKELNEAGDYIGGSLNYLLLVDNDEDSTNPPPTLPKEPNAGRFNKNLVLQGQSGSLHISDEILIRTFMVPSICAKYGAKTSQFKYRRENEQCVGSIHNLPYDGGNFEHLTLKVEQDSLLGNYVYKKTKGYWAGDIHSTATGYFKVTFELDGEDIVSKTEAPDPDVKTESNDVSRAFAGIFTLGFNEIGVKVEGDKLRNEVSGIEDNLQSSISQALECIELPGDAVFRYKDIALTDARRLRLDLDYEKQIEMATSPSSKRVSSNSNLRELTYAPQGDWTKAETEGNLRYLSGNSSTWSVKLEGNTFVHAPEGNWEKAHSDSIINYLSWDRSVWVAKLEGNTFVHAPQGNWEKSHSDSILKYLDWNGRPWTVKLAA